MQAHARELLCHAHLQEEFTKADTNNDGARSSYSAGEPAITSIAEHAQVVSAEEFAAWAHPHTSEVRPQRLFSCMT